MINIPNGKKKCVIQKGVCLVQEAKYEERSEVFPGRRYSAPRILSRRLIF